ncbi:hypothetical protein Franean1_6278 [Parafrankia sp. EAN1pec]|uniref:hypothetical protein n=1 Tax=Parafrankia sp. (strain EAN1pec) TaxID=298653 RepID=UPI0000544FFF|nr:hypothetical protein Franean1_6278 [Frankia sp. EAN1pec]
MPPPPIPTSTDDLDGALTALDSAASPEQAADAEGLIARILARRAERTRDRLAIEANAARLAELQALREEIAGHAGDANEIHSRLTAAVEAVSELVAAVDARRARFAEWRAGLTRTVPEGWESRPQDAGFGWHSHDPSRIAVDRGSYVGQLDVAVLLGLVLHQVAAGRATPGGALAPAEINPRDHADLINDPAAYLRRQLGTGRPEAR